MASIFNALRFHVKDRLTVDGILRVQTSVDFTGATVTSLGTITGATFTAGTFTGVSIVDSSISGGTAAVNGLTVDTTTLVVDATNNRVGIGTASPATVLHVYGNDTNIVQIESHTTTTNNQLFRNKNDVADTFDFRLNGSGSEGPRYGQIIHSADQPIGVYQSGQLRMIVDAGGKVGIGTASPKTLLHVNGIGSFGETSVAGQAAFLNINAAAAGPLMQSLSLYKASAPGPVLQWQHSRSTDPTVFTTLVDGDHLGQIKMTGDDGTSFVDGAFFRARVDGTISTGVLPTRWEWHLASASATVAEMMRLSSLNNLLIGGTVEAASAVKSLHLFNGTAPSAGVADGAVMYAKDVSASSVMHIMNESGDIIILDQQAALTAANAGVINSGDATTDAVIGNIRTRLGELETRLATMGILAA